MRIIIIVLNYAPCPASIIIVGEGTSLFSVTRLLTSAYATKISEKNIIAPRTVETEKIQLSFENLKLVLNFKKLTPKNNID